MEVYVICSRLAFVDNNLEITFEESKKRVFSTIGEAMAIAAYINELLEVHTFRVYKIKIKKHD